jgi:hypothetical protein
VSKRVDQASDPEGYAEQLAWARLIVEEIL